MKVKDFKVIPGPWLNVVALTECGQLFRKELHDGAQRWVNISEDLPSE